MALQKTLSSLLLLLLTLLGLGLMQPSYGQPMYQRFQVQHVDSNVTHVNNHYCNNMMQTRNMARPPCKQFNTFIHEQITTIINICNNPTMLCKNGWSNCHAGVVNITECSLISRVPHCIYQTTAFTAKQVVIACQGNPLRPVHFDR